MLGCMKLIAKQTEKESTGVAQKKYMSRCISPVLCGQMIVIYTVNALFHYHKYPDLTIFLNRLSTILVVFVFTLCQ